MGGILRTVRATTTWSLTREVLECSSQVQLPCLPGWKPLGKYTARGPVLPDVEGASACCRSSVSGKSLSEALRLPIPGQY